MVIASDNWNAQAIRPVGLIEAINCFGSYTHVAPPLCQWHHLHHQHCDCATHVRGAAAKENVNLGI